MAEMAMFCLGKWNIWTASPSSQNGRFGRPVFSPSMPATFFSKPPSRDRLGVPRRDWNVETGVTGRCEGLSAACAAAVALPARSCQLARRCGSSLLSLYGPSSPCLFSLGLGRVPTGMQDVDHKREPCPHRIIDGTLIRQTGGGAGPPPVGFPLSASPLGGGGCRWWAWRG